MARTDFKFGALHHFQTVRSDEITNIHHSKASEIGFDSYVHAMGCVWVLEVLPEHSLSFSCAYIFGNG